MLSSKLLQKQQQLDYYQNNVINQNQLQQQEIQKPIFYADEDLNEIQSRAQSGSSNEKLHNLPIGFGPNKKKVVLNTQGKQQELFTQTQSLTPGIRFSPLQKIKKFIQKEKTNKKVNGKKKNHKLWQSDFKIKRLTGIQELTPQESKKKRFKISFIYSDKQGKQHSATVRFGDRTRPEYVDTQDQNLRNYRLGMLGDVESKYTPFLKQYWNYYILNQQPTIQQAEAKYKEQFQLI